MSASGKTDAKCIKDKNYDLALEKLNYLANQGYRPDEIFLKRGQLCHQLLMLDEANADFTYVIANCNNKINAYYERMKLNYELGNYFETISDANKLLEKFPDKFEYLEIILLIFVSKI